MKSFALIVNPLTIEQFRKFWPAIKYLPRFMLKPTIRNARPFKVSHIAEILARYLKEGRIRVQKDRIEGLITYHDPCQSARNGGVIEEPRYVLRRLTSKFIEMTPTREYSLCCGGGGGLVALDNEEFREETGKAKVDQITETGAAIVATCCENCHTQLNFLKERYHMGVKVEFLTNMVANSLSLG